MRWRDNWVYPLIGLLVILLLGINSFTLIPFLALLIWLGLCLSRVRRRALALTVGAALLVAVSALLWVKAHPFAMEAWIAGRFVTRSSSGPGWTESAVPHFTVRYTEADSGARTVMDALPAAYRRVTERLGQPPDQILLVIYPDVQTMENALKTPFRKEGSASWFGGLMIFHSPATWSDSFRATASVEQMAAHELAHGVVNRLTQKRAPKWLNEGVAVYTAGQYTPELAAKVAALARQGRLYSIDQVNDAFRSPDDAAGLDRGQAYAQAGSFVSYLAERYGSERLLQLLIRLGQGETLEKSVAAAFGLSLSELEGAWVRSLSAP